MIKRILKWLLVAFVAYFIIGLLINLPEIIDTARAKFRTIPRNENVEMKLFKDSVSTEIEFIKGEENSSFKNYPYKLDGHLIILTQLKYVSLRTVDSIPTKLIQDYTLDYINPRHYSTFEDETISFMFSSVIQPIYSNSLFFAFHPETQARGSYSVQGHRILSLSSKGFFLSTSDDRFICAYTFESPKNMEVMVLKDDPSYLVALIPISNVIFNNIEMRAILRTDCIFC